MSSNLEYDFLELLVGLSIVSSHSILHSLQQVARSSDVQR